MELRQVLQDAGCGGVGGVKNKNKNKKGEAGVEGAARHGQNVGAAECSEAALSRGEAGARGLTTNNNGTLGGEWVGVVGWRGEPWALTPKQFWGNADALLRRALGMRRYKDRRWRCNGL